MGPKKKPNHSAGDEDEIPTPALTVDQIMEADDIEEPSSSEHEESKEENPAPVPAEVKFVVTADMETHLSILGLPQMLPMVAITRDVVFDQKISELKATLPSSAVGKVGALADVDRWIEAVTRFHKEGNQSAYYFSVGLLAEVYLRALGKPRGADTLAKSRKIGNKAALELMALDAPPKKKLKLTKDPKKKAP